MVYFPHAAAEKLFEGKPATVEAVMLQIEAGHLQVGDATHGATDDSSIAKAWIWQHDLSECKCIHEQRGLRCATASQGHSCYVGRRCVKDTMLTGPVLQYWNIVKRILGTGAAPVQAVLHDDKRVLVGVMLTPEKAGADVRDRLTLALEGHTAPDLSSSSSLVRHSEDDLPIKPIVPKVVTQIGREVPKIST